MKLLALGLAMLATGLTRGRETPPSGATRQAVEAQQLMTTTAGDVRAAAGVVPGGADGEDDDAELASPPGPGDWQVACNLKSGAPLIFDRGSMRELGATTLVRWAAPGDPRVPEPAYTALVSCSEKSIEAAWPGTRSETRAGTCGRQLVEAVCASVSKSRVIRKPRP